jgi:lecithin:retinol acyltransferase
MKRTDNSDSMLRRLNSLDDRAVAELPLGSWLVSPRRGYTHHGIYVGGGRVVHYGGLSRGWRRGPVEIVSFAEFCPDRSLWVKSMPTARYVGLTAAHRALLRLGEDRYHVMTNNCEHFCAWCLDGESRSRQVEQWLEWPRAMRLAVASWFAQIFTRPGNA